MVRFKRIPCILQAVVYTKGTCAEAQGFDSFCRAQQPPVPFVYAKTIGVFGQVFCDFGPQFVITDTDGAYFHLALSKPV